LVASVDPQLVVLGGGMSRAGALIAEPFTRHLSAMCLFEPHVVISTMGDESVALGAVRLALDEVQRHLLDVDGPTN
jgi:predicted NBD/HSP70 family sugar kinase